MYVSGGDVDMKMDRGPNKSSGPILHNRALDETSLGIGETIQEYRVD